jgi:hypothetical protein
VGINGGDSEDTRDSFDTPPRKSKKAKQSHSRDAAREVMTEDNETEGYKIRAVSNSTALGEDLIYPNELKQQIKRKPRQMNNSNGDLKNAQNNYLPRKLRNERHATLRRLRRLRF